MIMIPNSRATGSEPQISPAEPRLLPLLTREKIQHLTSSKSSCRRHVRHVQDRFDNFIMAVETLIHWTPHSKIALLGNLSTLHKPQMEAESCWRTEPGSESLASVLGRELSFWEALLLGNKLSWKSTWKRTWKPCLVTPLGKRKPCLGT